VGSKKNIITQVQETAKLFPDNVAVVTLLNRLDQVQLVANITNSSSMKVDMLAGYTLGTKGEDGYTPMLNLNNSALEQVSRRMWAMHEVAVVLDCLVLVLTALGEKFDY
jgi:hypothetical protein